MDQRPEFKSYNGKTFRRKQKGMLYDIGLGNNFLDMIPKASAIK